MAKKNTGPKKKPAAPKKAAAKPKPAAKKKTASAKVKVELHPRLAHAILSLRRFAPHEMEKVHALAAEHASSGTEATGCWISDSGGEQHCINLPPDVCTRQGGIAVPTKCPNT